MPKAETLNFFGMENISPIPECFNSGVGEGNCRGMVKHGTCPVVSINSSGRFPGCHDFAARIRGDADQWPILQKARICRNPLI